MRFTKTPVYQGETVEQKFSVPVNNTLFALIRLSFRERKLIERYYRKELIRVVLFDVFTTYISLMHFYEQFSSQYQFLFILMLILIIGNIFIVMASRYCFLSECKEMNVLVDRNLDSISSQVAETAFKKIVYEEFVKQNISKDSVLSVELNVSPNSSGKYLDVTVICKKD